MTQDEKNNEMIEWWLAIQEMNKLAADKEWYPIFGETVTITITPKCFRNYLDLEEQNN